MFNTIRSKLLMGFSAILLILISNTVYNLLIYKDSEMHLLHIRENTIASFGLASEMKANVIQISQYIADVSASKNTGHLKEAKEHYEQYKINSSELLELNPVYINELKALDKEVKHLYDYGIEMANMYIENGHEEGNSMMEVFDKMVDNIYGRVDVIQKKSEASMNEDLMKIQSHMTKNQNSGVILAVIITVMAFLVSVILSKSITRPIYHLLDIFHDLEKGQGDLTRRIYIKSKDEIAKMALSFNNFMDNLENMVYHIKRNSIVVSDSSEKLKSGSIQTSDGILVINTQMNSAMEDTQRIGTLIDQISSGIFEVARTAGDSANDAQQISAETQNISNIAQVGGELALNTKFEMEKTDQISSSMISLAEQLGYEAEKIDDIIDTIEAITAQTNLLAINASIEAARAGEQGKGFGVVAAEIRKLAESSSRSTKVIKDIIDNIQKVIHNTTKATEDVGKKVKQGYRMVENVYIQLQFITDGVSNINKRIHNIALSSREQSNAINGISETMESIHDSNSAITEAMQKVGDSLLFQQNTITELSTTASDLNQSAEQLSRMAGKFNLREITADIKHLPEPEYFDQSLNP